eukprot:1157398-Pelagomonas_calceolata.AAC.10
MESSCYAGPSLHCACRPEPKPSLRLLCAPTMQACIHAQATILADVLEQTGTMCAPCAPFPSSKSSGMHVPLPAPSQQTLQAH